ncbi:CoA transferase [Nocardioides sp.]|uniref:CaiB/BaiF CoA-transferase family protein n=1 Tax=Nocardioides sp. TaxID=35761 RepID=UPI003D124D7F
MSTNDRLHVVDLAGLLAGQLAARALSDAGAHVIRIDGLSGNPLGAFAADLRRSHLATLASVGKTLMRVNLEETDGSESAERVLERADVVVLSYDTPQELRLLAERIAGPRAVVCDISVADEGLVNTDDPIAQDAFVQALAGTAQVNGDPIGAPLPNAVGLLHSLTACHAAIAILAACIPISGRKPGIRLTVSMRDVAISMALEHHALARDTGGRLPERRQGNHSDGDTLGIYQGPTADYVIEVWGEGPDSMWARLARAMDRPDLATDSRFATDRARVDRMPEIADVVEAWLRRYSDSEVERRLDAAKVTFGRVLRSDETLRLPQLRERGISTGRSGDSALVCLPLSGVRRIPGLRNSDDASPSAHLPSREHFPSAPSKSSATVSPLAGMKVVELGAAIAGPMATRILADLGATVVKIESPGGDMMRSYRPATYDGMAIFAQFSAGKRSIALNLQRRGERDIAHRLIAQADVVVQNVTAGSLDRLGLGYDHCRRLNPQLIYCSVSGFGQSGDWRARRAVDPTIQGWAGIVSLMGEPGGPAFLDRAGFLDSGTASQAALSCIAEWVRGSEEEADRSLDVAMLDSALALDCFVAGAMWGGAGHLPFRAGRLHALGATVSVVIEDAWHFVEVSGSGPTSAWGRLASALGLDQKIEDPRFVDDASRLSNSAAFVDLLDSALKQDPPTVRSLAAMNVAAVRAATPWEAVRDGTESGGPMFETVVQGDGRACETMLMPWRFEDERLAVGVCPALDEARADLSGVFEI